MKKIIATIVGTVMCSVVFAQAPETVPIVILPGNTMENMPPTAKAISPPGTYEQVKWLAQDAAQTASKIDTINKQIEDVSKRGEALATRMRAHNAQWPNGCVYPQDNPRFCDGWVQEGNQLNTEMAPLKAEYQTLRAARGQLNSHQAVTLAQLRFRAFFERYTSWEKMVVGCAQMQSEESAQSCLKTAWEIHP
jgi:hypothetical protein